MARHNGVEFLYEFKSYTEWRDVPVIALVSRLNHDMADHGSLRRELGVQKVLIRSQLTLKNLCEAVTSAGQPKPVLFEILQKICHRKFPF
jgi:hypothetical protein